MAHVHILSRGWTNAKVRRDDVSKVWPLKMAFRFRVHVSITLSPRPVSLSQLAFDAARNDDSAFPFSSRHYTDFLLTVPHTPWTLLKAIRPSARHSSPCVLSNSPFSPLSSLSYLPTLPQTFSPTPTTSSPLMGPARHCLETAEISPSRRMAR